MSHLIRSMVLIFCMLATPWALADYPTQHIRLIVPFAPGGSVDILARLISEEISTELGQSVIVENKPGAASTVGTVYAARAKPDGYTLLMGSTSSLAINPSLRKLPYDPGQDFVPVAWVASVPHILAVSGNSPFNTLEEMLEYGRKNPTKISYGSVGVGSPHHLAGVMLNQMAGIEAIDVPYSGTAPLLTDLASGEVDVASVDIAPALSYLNGGRIKALALATDKRNSLAPEVPTTLEAGLSEFKVTGWYGIVAPTGVPDEVINRLSQVISAALTRPDVREKIERLGATPEGGEPNVFGSHLERERTKWTQVITAANLQLD